MTDMREQNQALDLLDRTLEAFGADTARWPAGVKAKLMGLIASNADARSKIAEAAALDKVLAFAPTISAARQSELADQIVAKALRSPRAVSVSDQPARSSVPSSVPSRIRAWRQNAIVGGALAASLMIGILSGQNTTVGTFSEAMISGVDATDTSAQQVAQGDELVTFYEEDLL
ncbi:MAG: hypothetical protein IKE66_09085 [Hyphomicrobium sp.]|nr:hypothetical protein [Hyphomicrobium sp.]